MGRLVSIIIPCKSIDGYAEQCVERCLSVDYEPKEIIVLPDSLMELEIKGIKVIAPGPPCRRPPQVGLAWHLSVTGKSAGCLAEGKPTV